MKLIHLSDLHIGKRLGEVSLLEEQAYILQQILAIMDAEAADGVLICGDVYDKSVPSAEAVALFDDFLCGLAKRQKPVFIISGNHDSPERLSFGGRLMTGAGIYVSPVYAGSVTPITLTDRHGPVNVWLLPFLKPAQVRRFFPEESIESYNDALATALSHMALEEKARNVLLTHQFVTGASVCDSEELSVGGSENVDASLFDGFDYVALGHIHGPQNIGSSRIRYCGTPLKYSFSEEHHHKSVTVVQLEEKGSLRLETVPLIPRRELRSLRGSFAQLTEPGQGCEDYMHLILTDEEDVPEAVGKLRTLYPNLLKLSYDNTRTRADQTVGMAEDVQQKSPLTLFGELYEKQNNQPLSAQQSEYLQGLVEEIWEDRT